MIKITLDKAKLLQIQKYVDNRNYSYYNNQRSASDPKSDEVLGKLGELAVSSYIQDKFDIETTTDFSIHKPQQKSFSADLGKNIHCKACSLYTRDILQRYGRKTAQYSWTFQDRDILKEKADKDIVVLTFVNINHKQEEMFNFDKVVVEIVAAIPWSLMVPLLENPLLKKHIGKKYAIYSDHVDFIKYTKTTEIKKVIKSAL